MTQTGFTIVKSSNIIILYLLLTCNIIVICSVRMMVKPDPILGYEWFDKSSPETSLLQDLYFFGHGKDFRTALADFAVVSGPASLPPSHAFGLWWSTWYNFSQSEFSETILSQYARNGIPLDVVVFDMVIYFYCLL